MSILSKIKSKFIKIKILDQFVLDDIPHRVIEYTSPIPLHKGKRELIFRIKNDNRTYIHSSIFLNPKEHFQPIYRVPQNIAHLWNKSFNAENALVLGCAGCSFPRFYAFEHPESKIIGVELSEKFVDIANKYFLLNEIEKQFDLYCDDAFKFVEEFDFKEKQDFVFVDIFGNGQFPSELYSDNFIKALYDCTSNNSAIVFNFLQEPSSLIMEFAKSIDLPFDKKFVVCANERCYLLLIRAEDNKSAEFESGLKEIAELFEC